MSMFTSGKVAARVESSLFHAGAMNINGTTLGTTNAANYQMRTTALRTFYLPLAFKGAIDLGITLHHNLGVTLNATLCDAVDMVPVLAENSAGFVKNGQKLWTGAIPTDARFTFIAERGSAGDSSVAARKVIEVPEFRQPINRFILELTPAAAPTAGDLFIRAIWRY